MKTKRLLSVLAVSALLSFTASAQLFTDHFNSGTMDTTMFKNHFNSGGVNIIQAGGPFALTQDNSNSALKITTAGHDEWDGIAVFLDDAHETISMSNTDKIYVRAKLDYTSVSDSARVVFTVSDVNKKTASNAALQNNDYMILLKNSWSTLAYAVSDWSDAWGLAGQPNGTCDKTQVQRINIAINNGFASYPSAGAHAALNGTILIDYIQIGGTAPANEANGVANIESQKLVINNYPNPATVSTKIQYSVVENGQVTVKVYDVVGKEVTTLVNENKSKGTYELNYNTSSLQSGLYFYTMTVNNKLIATQKLIVK